MKKIDVLKYLKKIPFIETDISDINTSLDDINKDGSRLVYIKEGENLQTAINRAIEKRATLELKPITYALTDSLTIDISKCSINGNGAILDFTQANISECIKIIATNDTPYRQNGRFIKNFEMLGNGRSGTQTGIAFNSTGMSQATSHIDLEKLNLRHFKIGIEYRSYSYLIRHYSVDVSDSGICLYMPTGYTDYGENINFYGCALYNSDNGAINENSSGSFHFTSCSIDYMQNYFLSSLAKIFFTNGHLEGSKGLLKGNISISNTVMVLNHQVPDNMMFDVSDSKTIIIKNSFLSTKGGFKQIAQGDGRVIFEGCYHNGISDFSTCSLNEGSSIINPKGLDLFATNGTATPTDRWSRTNCVITKDSGTFSTGSFSYKITKQYGAGSNSQVSIYIPRNKKCKKIFLDGLMKASTSCTMSVHINGANISLSNDSVGFPYVNFSKEFALYSRTIETSWTEFKIHINDKEISNDFTHYIINLNLYSWNGSGGSLWIDNIKVFEY